MEKDGKSSFIDADRILVSVGRKANITQVGLDKLNIELHRNGVVVDEHMLTSHHVYMLAVILPAFLYWHITAIREAEVCH